MNLDKPKLPPPKNMIGPRVIFLSKQIRQAFNETIAEQGLFSGQEDIVFTLVQNEGITLSALAKILGVSTATASVSVKRMEKSGFVYKKADKNDARIIRLYPTEKAKSAPEKIKIQMDSLDNIIKADMSNEEIEQLSFLLEKAMKNIKERGGNNA